MQQTSADRRLSFADLDLLESVMFSSLELSARTDRRAPELTGTRLACAQGRSRTFPAPPRPTISWPSRASLQQSMIKQLI